MILKLESNAEDTECALELLNMDKLEFESDLFQPTSRRNRSPGGSSEGMVAKYFGTLTKSQIRGLYQMYRYDFEAFEYDYESFLALGLET